jgi:hypothetical protein
MGGMSAEYASAGFLWTQCICLEVIAAQSCSRGTSRLCWAFELSSEEGRAGPDAFEGGDGQLLARLVGAAKAVGTILEPLPGRFNRGLVGSFGGSPRLFR